MSAQADSPSVAAAKSVMRAPLKALRLDQYRYLQLIVLAAGVGVFAALGNLGFRGLIELFSWIFQTLEWRLLGIGSGASRFLIPLILLSGGACILVLDRLFPGDVMGYGFPNFLEMVNLGKARIRRRWIVVKALGASLSLGAGASVGREGPIAQIGGAIGSAVAQFAGLPADRAKVLIAAGAGAGIATTFNAPMGGLMFGLEIVLLGQTELANLMLVLIATFSAVVTSRGLFGDTALFHPAPFLVKSYWEMVTYGLMGTSMGVLAAAYIRFFHSTGAFLRRLRLPRWVVLMGGLSIVGAIAIALPQNLSDGYPIIGLAFEGKFGLGLLAALMAAKFIASTISLDCGAPGGVFGPTFFIGAMGGGAFRFVCNLIVPGLTGSPGSYALVGLGAFLGGVTHAPLTAIFLLFEMTQLNYQIAMPAMIATITSLVVAHALEPDSIDTYSLAREGKKLPIGQDRVVLMQLPVESVMSREVDVVPANAPLAEVLRIAGQTAQANLPVLDNQGQLVGLIVTHDLLGLLAGGDEPGPVVNAYDLGRRNPPFVTPQSNLDEAMQLIEYEALDELPVLESPHDARFVGMVTRREIAQAFNRVAVSLSTSGEHDTGIFWATGYRVSRLQIPAEAEGKTLRELDPRARFSVSVLAVQTAVDDGTGFRPIAPDQKLQQGDLIILAGRSADIRRFIRDLEGA